MLKLGPVVLSLVFLGCASSRTDVEHANKMAQTVMSGAVNRLNDDPSAKVQLQISGHVIMTDKCPFLKKDFDVEIWPSTGSKYLYTTGVKEDSYSFDVGVPYEGAYKIQLVDARGKVIESKNFATSATNDRFQFDFHGCPE